MWIHIQRNVFAVEAQLVSVCLARKLGGAPVFCLKKLYDVAYVAAPCVLFGVAIQNRQVHDLPFDFNAKSTSAMTLLEFSGLMITHGISLSPHYEN